MSCSFFFKKTQLIPLFNCIPRCSYCQYLQVIKIHPDQFTLKNVLFCNSKTVTVLESNIVFGYSFDPCVDCGYLEVIADQMKRSDHFTRANRQRTTAQMNTHAHSKLRRSLQATGWSADRINVGATASSTFYSRFGCDDTSCYVIRMRRLSTPR